MVINKINSDFYFLNCLLLLKTKNKFEFHKVCVKTKLNTIEVSVSRVLIGTYINHDEFVSVSNMLKEYDDMKKEIKNPNNRQICLI